MSTDKYGRPLAAYPDEIPAGSLLGINGYGSAVYASDETVSLAVLDERGEIRSPPRTYWYSHELPLGELDMSRGQYVLYAVQNHGPWRALTEEIQTVLTENGVDLDDVRATPAADSAAVEDAATALLAADEWNERASHASELRLAIMDAPDAPALLTSLLPLLDDLDGERERFDVDDPVGTQPYDERTRNFDRIATRRDVAFAVSRVSRAAPDAVDPVLADVARIAGDSEFRDPDTAYKHHLVDVLDVAGRANTATTASTLCTLLADDDPVIRERTLSALYHLETKYVTDRHPLLATRALREAIEAAESDEVEAVRDAAFDIELIHDFDES